MHFTCTLFAFHSFVNRETCIKLYRMCCGIMKILMHASKIGKYWYLVIRGRILPFLRFLVHKMNTSNINVKNIFEWKELLIYFYYLLKYLKISEVNKFRNILSFN